MTNECSFYQGVKELEILLSHGVSFLMRQLASLLYLEVVVESVYKQHRFLVVKPKTGNERNTTLCEIQTKYPCEYALETFLWHMHDSKNFRFKSWINIMFSDCHFLVNTLTKYTKFSQPNKYHLLKIRKDTYPMVFTYI